MSPFALLAALRLFQTQAIRIPERETIFLTEGESDAIRLIDSGVEDDRKARVVAIQGASLDITPWAFLFTDKRAIIATDYDATGEKAARNIYRALSRVAASIERLDLRRAA